MADSCQSDDRTVGSGVRTLAARIGSRPDEAFHLAEPHRDWLNFAPATAAMAGPAWANGSEFESG